MIFIFCYFNVLQMQTETKVDHWLSHQHDLPSGQHDQPLKLVTTWDLIHVNTIEKKVYKANKFSISESEAIGISCDEKPSLSVMYPNIDESAVVLSRNQVYRSPTFVKVSGKEYLATACDEDGCLYFWDIKCKTSKKVFNPELGLVNFKYMNVFIINDNTIGYGEVSASPDGSRRVFILKTDTEEMTLCSTFRIFTKNNIWDMCYTEMDGGTACLLLCLPYGRRIMAVKMIGYRTRWEVGKEQMGEKFDPWSICTDEENTVYVTDFKQIMVHLLSAEDGSVIRSIDTRHYGMRNLIAVRFHDQHLYVEHKRESAKRYVISKFEKSA